MATNLKTDYKDYIPPESGKRYIITTDSQGYSTIQDATEYTQEGDTFGANDINATNGAINNLTAADIGAVPTSRTVNGKALSSNITLAASDVGALPIAGGTMTGVLNLKANQYGGTGPSDELYALNCQNSNIIGVNRILTADSAGGPSEGWGFKREDDGDKYDVIWAADGKLYFTPGFKYNTPPYPSNYTVLHSGGGTINGKLTLNDKLQMASNDFPQIFASGTIQIGGVNQNAYSIVVQSNRSDDLNALRPSVTAGQTGHMHLGIASQRWRDVYAQNGTIQTSDRNAKHDITPLDTEKMTEFIMGLKPISYVFNNSDSGRTHFGFIAQDIEELLPQIGMSDMDFAGFIKSPKTEDYYEDVSEIITDEETGEEKTVTRQELKTRIVEGEYIYSLRYTEFISPLISIVQKQQSQIEDLEQRLSALEDKEESV